MTDAIERMVDGVTVRKSFETDEFPVPAVTFEIESSREDPVEVTITDDIPDEVAMEQVGFHPDYHNDQWTAFPEGRVEFNHEFDSRASITTIYGVRLDDDDSQDAFLKDPDIVVERLEPEATTEGVVDDSESVEDSTESPPEDDVSVADTDRTNVVREVIEGERDSVPGLDEDTEREVAEVNGGGEPGDEVTASPESERQSTPEEVGVDEPDQPGEIDEPSDGPSGDTDEDEDMMRGGAGVTVDEASIGAALASELRSGTLDEQDLQTLEEAFGAEQKTETRIGHLQSRVSDLEAYSSAIEEFIDEHGSAQQLLQRVDDDLDTLASRVDSIESTTEEASSARQELQQSLNQAVSRIDDLESDLRSVGDDVDTLDQELEAVRDDVHDLDDDVEAVREDVEERLDDTVAELQDDLQDIRGDVRDLREWRNQLTDVFGAGDGDE